MTSKKILIQVAKDLGFDSVINTDYQLMQFTINRIISGDKSIISMVKKYESKK